MQDLSSTETIENEDILRGSSQKNKAATREEPDEDQGSDGFHYSTLDVENGYYHLSVDTINVRSTEVQTEGDIADKQVQHELHFSSVHGFCENTEKELGYAEDEDIKNLFQTQIKAAVEAQTISSSQSSTLLSLLMENREAFGTKKSVTQLSSLPPMRVRLKGEALPILEKPRRMGNEKMEALRKKLDDLLRIGMIEQVNDPVIGAPVFMVPKKAAGQYRMVIDLRAINDIAYPAVLILPEISMQLSYIPTDARFFGSLDMLFGFDLLAVDDRDKWVFVLISIFGAFRMNGSPMGYLATPAVYQNRLVRYVLGWKGKSPPVVTDVNGALLGETEGVFCRQDAGCLLWIDDILIYARTWEGYLAVLRRILQNMIKYKVRANAQKCDFIAQMVNWCGRSISFGGWKFQRSHFEKILSINEPRTLKELEQVVYILGWLGESIPNHAKVKDHFKQLATHIRHENNILDNKRRKGDENISLKPFWTVVDAELYRQLLKLMDIVSKRFLANYNSKLPVEIYSDASDRYWGLVILQIDEQGIKRPLTFLSGKFNKTELKWSINDKELYPIVFAVRRFDYLVENSKVSVLTDHKNLTYLTSPEDKTLKGSTLNRVYRWSIVLADSGVKLKYIKGESNVMADALSRWMYPDLARALHVQFVRTDHLTRSRTWTKTEDVQLMKLLQWKGIGRWHAIMQTNLQGWAKRLYHFRETLQL